MSNNGVRGNGYDGEKLTIATQGLDFSFHALAARKIAGEMPVVIEGHEKFGDVISAARAYEPGMGIVAVRTVMGTVQDAVIELVSNNIDAAAQVVDRVEVDVDLAVMSAMEQSIDELRKRDNVTCHAQRAAWLQCEQNVHRLFPRLAHHFCWESTIAIQQVLDAKDPNQVAIGPRYAAEAMGAVILGPEKVNPDNSVTSFYVLQRDENEQILPINPERTDHRTVLALFYPYGDGEFEKVMELAADHEIKITRYIPFEMDKKFWRNPKIKRNGGIVEFNHYYRQPQFTEFRARIHKIKSNTGEEYMFDTHKLGRFLWYPEEPIPVGDIKSTAHAPEFDVIRKILL